MLRSQVDILLESYKRNIGRRGHITAEIARVKREIALTEAGVADISVRMVTGMPSSGALRDETSRKATMLADGDIREARALKETLNRLSGELARVELDIAYVENWLKALSDRERHVVNSFIIEGDTWQKVAASYRTIFGRGACETTLRRLRGAALDKIYAIAV